MKVLLMFAVFVFLASSCSCSRLRPLTDDYFDALESGSFGEEDVANAKTFNVMDYGAVGNGITDDSPAFEIAWGELCGAEGAGVPTFFIPSGKSFVIGQVKFQGPCKAKSVRVQIRGSLVSPPGISWAGNDGLEKWIMFDFVDNLIINGGGIVDGQGHFWWTACGKKHLNVRTFGKNGHYKCQKPTALHFHSCNGIQLSGLTHLNSARNHISISGCNNVTISQIKIMAPESSPNTDGIDISTSSNVSIRESYIGTGDDCIAINGGSSQINITDVSCGPGHGISIGSLGADGAYETVEEVNIENCYFRGTDNGVRIKTWKGGRGYARNITFKNINFHNSKNPIVINQFYFNKHKHQLQGESHYQEIKVSDVRYSNISGTSANDVAINLNCKKNGGCTNIEINHVKIAPAVPGMQLHSVCSNAYGIATSASPAIPCLSH